VGNVVGAAILSHHPGLMLNEELRILAGAGRDSDLIAGYNRVREKIAALRPDALIIFDSHWFTTGFNLIDGGDHYQGTYLSDEMPWYLFGVPYKYRGHPELSMIIEDVGREQGTRTRAIRNPDLGRTYATVNIIKQLRLDMLDIPVVSASCCQNCRWDQFLPAGQVVGEAIRRSDLRVVLVASGALSHKFNNIEWVQKHPRIYHEDNVSSRENVASDKRAIDYLVQGRHDLILSNWEDDFRKRNWEAFGGHYLQMLGAMGGAACSYQGEVMSEYENARGTGNVHIWFETQR
jgi:3,4-dihydroxyphenylacetate 2,3-dioxygenase